MYNRSVTAAQTQLASEVLGYKLKQRSIAEVEFYNRHFDSLTDFNDKGIAIGWRKDLRPHGPTREEARYIEGEIAMCKLDFLYFGTRYVFIKDLSKEIVRWAPNIAQL